MTQLLLGRVRRRARLRPALSDGVCRTSLVRRRFRLGMLAANVAGSFLMRFMAAWLVTGQPVRAKEMRASIATGVLGGFTTFSAFSLAALLLGVRGALALAVLCVGASVALSLEALLAGLALSRSLA